MENKKRISNYQFGFTGTPIFQENALSADTTAIVFGRELHSYVITDAIRDEKVLKFKVDYNDVRPKFKSIETEQDEKKLKAIETKEAACGINKDKAACCCGKEIDMLVEFAVKWVRQNPTPIPLNDVNYCR